MLSQRIIHFIELEVVFECNDGIDCECGGVQARTLHTSFQKTPSIFGPVNSQKQATMWRAIVEDYSKLDLTYVRDRLPALSGLAHAFEERHSKLESPGRYLAGLWESTFKDDLAWFYHIPARNQSGEYVAPTWSWAGSMASKLASSKPPEEHLFGITSMNTEIDSADEMRQLKSATLCLHGHLVEVRWERRNQFSYATMITHPPDLELITLGNLEEEEESSTGAHCASSFHDIHIDYDFGVPGPDCIPEEETLYVFALGITYYKSMRCLVLRRTANSGANVFQRVGFAEMFCKLVQNTLTTDLTII